MKRSLLFLFLLISFQNLYAIPVISSFSPTSGPIGTSVTISGTGFSSTPTSNTVFFGATQAIVTAATTTQLTVKVPIGATYQFITVMVSNLVANSFSPFIVTFCSDNSINTNSFTPRVDFATPSNPYAIAICDLDGNGKSELVVINYNGNSFSVFKNISTIGSISLAARVDFATGANPISVSISDIDLDGKPDVVVTIYNSNRVSVFRNTSTLGNISFDSEVNFITGSNPRSVAIGDIDLNGKPEVVVVNASSATVSIFRNTSIPGTISFAAKVDFTTGTSPRSVTIGDIDGNGKADIAVANYSSSTVSVLRNLSTSGTISFATKVDFATGTFPIAIAIGDIDGNGKPDLSVANFTSNTISVFRNLSTSGTISLATKVDFNAGSSPNSIAIGEIGGDGKPDIVITYLNPETVSVFKNTSTSGTISLAAKIDYTSGSGPYNLTIGDIDGDGKPDVAVADYSSNAISVFRNLINGSLPLMTSASTASVCSGNL
ncbi:MAG: FG-GAP-like repeat-containing protein, partial [Bacteroidota bacterium]